MMNYKQLAFFYLTAAALLMWFSGVPKAIVWWRGGPEWLFPSFPFWLAQTGLVDWIASWPVMDIIAAALTTDPETTGAAGDLWNQFLDGARELMNTDVARTAQFWVLKPIIAVVIALGGVYVMAKASLVSFWKAGKHFVRHQNERVRFSLPRVSGDVRQSGSIGGGRSH